MFQSVQNFIFLVNPFDYIILIHLKINPHPACSQNFCSCYNKGLLQFHVSGSWIGPGTEAFSGYLHPALSACLCSWKSAWLKMNCIKLMLYA